MKEFYVGEEMNVGSMDQLHQIPDGQPFALINLLLYHDWANYPPGTATEKLTGKQAYNKYTELAIPFVNEVGGTPMWRGEFGVNLVGPDDEQWDEIIVMQYPARSAFERMFGNPGYQDTLFHRTAGVKDSRLYGMTSPQSIGPMKWKLLTFLQNVRGD